MLGRPHDVARTKKSSTSILLSILRITIGCLLIPVLVRCSETFNMYARLCWFTGNVLGRLTCSIALQCCNIQRI